MGKGKLIGKEIKVKGTRKIAMRQLIVKELKQIKQEDKQVREEYFAVVNGQLALRKNNVDRIKYLEEEIVLWDKQRKKEAQKVARFRGVARKQLAKPTIEKLEAMKRFLQDKEKGRWKKKEQAPSPPPPGPVARAIVEITKAKANVKIRDEVEFIKGLTKDKSIAVIKDERVINALKEATPDLAKSPELFEAILKDIIENKPKK